MSRYWFNSEALKKLMSENARAALMRAGAFVRRTAMGLIRTAKKGESAKPGRPPKAHKGTLRDLIVYEWDSELRQVVIGPRLVKPLLDGGTVPNVLEFGGTERPRRRKRANLRIALGRQRVARVWKYRGNPFMAPALEKNIAKVVKMFDKALIGPGADVASMPVALGPSPGGTIGSQ